ncbi:hypothetical protein FB45DRAFT_1072942 [Roridomyces roridus]|uniref:Peptidase C14 caspase domain-containing protein n=1 Tax=Roridomyces roridus TaxID=1738132 RepID=A0AAD7AX25_9AGAR|nr:hypothetical protein FB45DRAFT_1072942 [Roridomyces roridus]
MSHEKLNRAPLPHTIPMASASVPLKPQVFALIVGINKYIAQDILPPLQGCVNDATLFKSFLDIYCTQNSFDLQVKVLLNEDATRSGILDTFTAHLLNNPAIPNGGHTPMIFFFAGHGSRVDATDNKLSMDGRIETICPHDEHAIVNGKYVHGIPDYVLGALLLNLAYTKGDNITVILDSCHSSGIARAELPDSGTARSPIYPSLPIPAHLDRHLLVPTGRLTSAAQICVILAACKQMEPARESSTADDPTVIHGRFTRTFVACLSALLPLKNTTYRELHALLDKQILAHQEPSCIGFNDGRLIFGKGYPSGGASVLSLRRPVRAPSSRDSFIIDLGSIAGVVAGTEFAVYDERQKSANLVILRAASVKMHESVLVRVDPRQVIANDARVVPHQWNNPKTALRVAFASDFPHATEVFPTEFEGPWVNHRYVESQLEDAHVVLHTDDEGGMLIVERRAPAMQLDGVVDVHIPLNANHDNLPNILNEIAHFNHFLFHTNDVPGLRLLGGRCELRMFRLIGERPSRKQDPDFADFVQMDKESETLVAHIPSEMGVKYGFEIVNNSHAEVFAYLFYFDPEHYTILPIFTYIPGTPPIPQNGGIERIGFGGDAGMQFQIDDNSQLVSSGFFKLFVATQPLYLEWIRREDALHAGVGRLIMVKEPERDRWDTEMVVVTMRAEHTESAAMPPTEVIGASYWRQWWRHFLSHWRHTFRLGRMKRV